MFNVKNTKTGKLAKDPITMHPHSFESVEHAQKFADGMTLDSVLRSTAWNSVRKTTWKVVAA